MNKFKALDRVRHIKSGNIYRIVTTSKKCKIEATNESAYIYRLDKDPNGTFWVRPQIEMEDGRFELA